MTNQTVPEHLGTFDLPGNSPGVLLIHGFTGDTSEMRALADQINREIGLACYAPILPGHGLPPSALLGITDDDWLAAVRHAYDTMQQRHGMVIVVAFSMGAAVSAVMLSTVQALAFVAISPMITTRLPLIPFTPWISRLMPWIYPLRLVSINAFGLRERLLHFDPTLDLEDPHVLARLRTEVRVPVAIAEALRNAAHRAILAAPVIQMPTLVVQGESDLTLSPHGARKFFQALAAKDKTFVTFPGADHDFVRVNRPGNDVLLSTVSGWIRQRLEQQV